MSEKIKKTFRLDAGLCEELKTYSEKEAISETAVVEQALLKYFKTPAADELADIFLEKFESKYKEYMTKIRLGVWGADKNSQILVDCFNSMLSFQGVPGEAYRAASSSKHDLIIKAEGNLKETIAKAKEKKDNKRY